MRPGALVMAALALAACAKGPTVIPVVPLVSPEAGLLPDAAVGEPMSRRDFRSALDRREVARIFPRTRESVEVVLCNQQRHVVEMPPIAAQGELMARSYRSGCR